MFIKKINSLKHDELQILLHGHEVNHSNDDQLETIEMNSSEISNWIDEIVNEAKEWIKENDDGNQDNSLQNHGFAEHFIRLCKLLPLWNASTSKFYRNQDPVESSCKTCISSAHAEGISYRFDDFLRKDIELADGEVNKAYCKYIGHSNSEGGADEGCNDSASYETLELELNEILSDEPEIDENQATEQQIDKENVPMQSNTCLACQLGDGTDMHKCKLCEAFVHRLSGCSVPFHGGEEGEVDRICIACNQKQCSDKDLLVDMSPETQRLNITDQNEPKEKKAKVSNDSTKEHRKIQLGHLLNANLSRTVHKVKGKTVTLTNTCALDSIIQILAAAYAYHESYKIFAESSKDDIFEIVKLLATK